MASGRSTLCLRQHPRELPGSAGPPAETPQVWAAGSSPLHQASTGVPACGRLVSKGARSAAVGSTWQSHVPSGACGDSAPRPSQQGMCRSDHQPRPSPQSNDSAMVRHRVMGSLPIQKVLHFQVETGGPGTGLETASLPWPQRGGLSRVTMWNCQGQRCAHRRVTQAALGTPHSNSLFLPNLEPGRRAPESQAVRGLTGGRQSQPPTWAAGPRPA